MCDRNANDRGQAIDARDQKQKITCDDERTQIGLQAGRRCRLWRWSGWRITHEADSVNLQSQGTEANRGAGALVDWAAKLKREFMRPFARKLPAHPPLDFSSFQTR